MDEIPRHGNPMAYGGISAVTVILAGTIIPFMLTGDPVAALFGFFLAMLFLSVIGNSLVAALVMKWRYGSTYGIGEYATGAFIGTMVALVLAVVIFILSLVSAVFAAALSGGQ